MEKRRAGFDPKRIAKRIGWGAAAGVLLSPWEMPTIEKFFQRSGEENIKLAAQIWKEHPQAVLIMVANHQSHADAIPVTQVARQIIQETGKKFLLVTAASTKNNGQSSSITALTKKLEPWCNAQGVEFADVVTKNDILKGRAKPGAGTAGLRKLLSAKKTGNGIIILPEGTVEAGRFVKPAESDLSGRRVNRRNGMQDATDNFGNLISLMGNTEEIIILPVGIDGSYNVFDPDTLRPTQSVIKGFLGAHIRKSVTPAVNVQVGRPFMLNDFLLQQKINPTIQKPGNLKQISAAVMQEVASLVPPEARGFYRHP